MGQGDWPLGLIGILSIFAAAGLYLYKLDEIPGLTVFQALLLMLIARATDLTSFLMVTGGKVSSQELNKGYQVFVKFLPHVGAMALVQVAGLLLVGSVIVCFWLAGSRRGVLTWIAVFTTFSLVAAFFNLAGGIPI